MSEVLEKLKKTDGLLDQAIACIVEIRSLENEFKTIESEIASLDSQKQSKRITAAQYLKQAEAKKKLLKLAQSKKAEKEKRAVQLIESVGGNLQSLKSAYNLRFQNKGVGRIE